MPTALHSFGDAPLPNEDFQVQPYTEDELKEDVEDEDGIVEEEEVFEE